MVRRLLIPLSAFALLASGCGTGGPATHVYRIPSSGMEPTLHCAKPVPGCRGKGDDLVKVRLSGSANLKRREILVFTTPPEAALRCGEGGTFVKRLVGLPGETVHEDDHGFIEIDGRRLTEPYVLRSARLTDTNFAGETWHVPKGKYFVLGDNRSESCDSRVWGSVPAHNIKGPVLKIVRPG